MRSLTYRGQSRSRKRQQLSLRVLRAALLAAQLVRSSDLLAQKRETRREQVLWIGATAVLAGTAGFDERLARALADRRSGSLDRLEEAGNTLGTGRILIPTMAAAYLGARLTRRHELARAVLHGAAAYTVTNALVSTLKPAIGRHRPDSSGGAWRFRPMNAGGEWHAFPSAHAGHAFSLAAVVADRANRPWITVASFGAAGIVGWSRVYKRQHWPSDIAASAALGVLATRITASLFPEPPQRARAAAVRRSPNDFP